MVITILRVIIKGRLILVIFQGYESINKKIIILVKINIIKVQHIYISRDFQLILDRSKKRKI